LRERTERKIARCRERRVWMLLREKEDLMYVSGELAVRQ
jgi:hypothetical protein